MQLPESLVNLLSNWHVFLYTTLAIFGFFLLVFIILWWRKRRLLKKIQKKNEEDFLEGRIILPTDKRDYTDLEELKEKSVNHSVINRLRNLNEVSYSR